MRSFIYNLEKIDELSRIRERVNWKYEIGEITRERQQSDSNPALLFENIKDYPGCSVLTNGLSSYSKIAIAIGINPSTPFKEIVKTFKGRITNPLEPNIKNDSPVKKNSFTGDNVDLLTLPVPWWSRKDGGRYIGTWHLNITKDPYSGHRNVGIYRMQLLGKRTTAVSFSPNSHLAKHLTKAKNKNIPLEMAVAIGVNERLIMAAAAAPPYGVDEYHMAGGLAGTPIELVKCDTVDLEVPANSEIILEGKILPEVKITEGPFLDYSGIPKGDPEASVFEVSCLSYRESPIFRGAAIGIPGAEDHLLFSLLSNADCLDFHGSRIRQKIQNNLLKKGYFSGFQKMGKIRRLLKK